MSLTAVTLQGNHGYHDTLAQLTSIHLCSRFIVPHDGVSGSLNYFDCNCWGHSENASYDCISTYEDYILYASYAFLLQILILTSMTNLGLSGHAGEGVKMTTWRGKSYI